MNEIQVTLRGNVATEPRYVRFDDGNTLTSFRLASTARRYDRERQEWVDRSTTYVNVTCRRAMATNAANSVRKGQPLLVTGKLTERHWSTNGRSGQTLEIHAEGIGHDLTYGTSQFARMGPAEPVRRPVDVSALPVVVEPSEAEDGPGSPAELDGCEVVDGTEVLDQGASSPARLDLTAAG
jgi:single-stranded DNA-binding protein